MKAIEAAGILNRMAYKPGYRVDAWPVAEYVVTMELTLDTWNSTPWSDGRMSQAMILSPPARIDCEKLDKEGVMGAGLLAVLQIEAHETREFWREGRGGPAPFHPHNKSGEEAMKRIAGIQVDITYPEPW